MIIFSVEVIECAVCQGAVQALDSLLDNAKVDEEIKVTLEKACNRLPSQYYKKVSNFILKICILLYVIIYFFLSVMN